MVRRFSAALVVLLGLGCGESVRYDGVPGQPIAVTLIANTPAIPLRVNDVAEQLAVVDTGAPLTLLSRNAYPTLAAGRQVVTLGAFGLAFPEREVGVAALFSENGPCVDKPPAGLVGGDLLRFFRVGLDHRARTMALFADEAELPAQEVDAKLVVPAEVVGGGQAVLPGGALLEVPATRFLVTVETEGRSLPAMIDTGASMSVVSRGLLERLGEAGRPALCCESVSFVNGKTQAKVVRLKDLKVGGLKVTSLAALVIDDPAFFSALNQETRRSIDLLLGNNWLREAAVTFDYPAEQLELRTYRRPSVTSEDYLLPGFSFCKAAQAEQGMVVLDVFKGSDAERQGVRTGERLVAVDGQDLSRLSKSQALELFRRLGSGARPTLSFGAGGTPLKRAVAVEALLPDYH
ncbi:MAG: aspartyl protease family protein [Deltaproteobacteria bacterium]|nr:aspartyl protease family protein [Deltaproteobacteria bacterium]